MADIEEELRHKRKLKIKARKNVHDKWQEFTGVKTTTIEEMVIHCQNYLIDMPYQFSIFGYKKTFPVFSGTCLGKWFLIRIIKLKGGDAL